MINCSVCILTYNSEKTLDKCLNSVRDFLDIIILDGGSSDGTLEIAKKYNARVFPQREDGQGRIVDFTYVRQRLFSLAKEDWRLWLDSDEWLSEEMKGEIERITASEDVNTLYAFGSKIVINGKIIDYAYFYPLYYKRLFNLKSDVRWRAGKKVHESLVFGPNSVVKTSAAVFYHDWNKSYGDFIEKDNHYLSLTVLGKENIIFSKKIRIAVVNILKASKVFVKSFWIYLCHGFRHTLPIPLSWRFVRYHLLYAKKILTK